MNVSEMGISTYDQPTILPVKVNWQPEDMSYFRKCGEITASPDVECFGLNCRFCSGICLQFEVFMQHLREQHSKDILAMYSTTCEKQTQTNAFIDTQGEIGQNEQLPADKLNELTQIMPGIEIATDLDANSYCNNVAELNTLSTNLVNSNGTLTIQLELLPENNKVPQVPLEDLLSTSSLSSTYCFVENTLPDILLSVDDALEPNNSAPTIVPQIAATTNDNGTTITTTLSEEQIKPMKQNQKQFNESIIYYTEENRDILSYLLECIKSNQQQLWTTKQAFRLSQSNKNVYEEISKSLLRDKKVCLSAEEIFNVMKNLIVKYYIEKEKTQKSANYMPKLWCFEQIHILANSLHDNNAKSQNDTACLESYDKINDNRDILAALIKAFKDDSSLWNPKNTRYTEEYILTKYDCIAQQLKEQFRIKISGRDCFTEIQKLCKRYRKELRLMHKFKERHVPKLWCFNQLEFLRDVYEQQLIKSLKKCPSVSEPEQSVHKIQYENSEKYLQFIELYKYHGTLWNVDHPDYRSTAYRNKALSRLLEEINEIQCSNYTMEQLQKTIDDLRKDFSAMKRKQLMSKSTTITETRKELEFLSAHIGPFRCSECAKLIKTTDQYKIHMSQHNGTQPFTCALCGKGFQMSGNLSVHIRRHKRDLPYKCEVCNKSFATSTEVAIHKRKHTGERPYSCNLCDKTYKTWSFYDIHRRSHLNQSPFLCPICDRGFYERTRYTDHMNGHLNIRKHECSDCKKTFINVANLKKHLELHLPVKKYKCLICGKRFAQSASLRWHKTKQHVDNETVMET